MNKNLKALIEKTDFEALFAKKGYAFFTNGDYNVNIIGVRNLLSATKSGDVYKNVQRDQFDDALVLIYKVDGKWKKEIFENTTDPGLKLLKNPSNSNGCAILVPGQYRSTYKIDLHNGKYKALCQRSGLVSVYRDKNRNNVLDMDPKTIQKGYFGINIHKAGVASELIGGYSAGCQVFKKVADFNHFMDVINKSKDRYGNTFTYTLVTTEDLK